MSDDFESREIDSSRPSAARMYHHYLSGEARFDVDRVFGARSVAPEARVVYADNDSEAVTRSSDPPAAQQALDTTAVIEADLCLPEQPPDLQDPARPCSFAAVGYTSHSGAA